MAIPKFLPPTSVWLGCVHDRADGDRVAQGGVGAVAKLPSYQGSNHNLKPSAVPPAQAPTCQGVDFIQEDDGGGCLAGQFEGAPQQGLALPHVHAVQLGP